MPSSSTQRANARSEATRARLIEAAVELFGTYGYDAVTTRRLAERAQVNQVAIPYHFGGKEGLYVAVAEHIVARIGAQTAPVLQRMREAGSAGLGKESAAELLHEILHRVGVLIVGSAEAEHWARFIMREQMDPSPAFEVLYRGMFGAMLQAVTRLLAILLDGDPADEEIKIQAISIVGQLLVFRVGRAAVLRVLDWESVGSRELLLVRSVIDRNLDAILTAGRQ